MAQMMMKKGGLALSSQRSVATRAAARPLW
jgi:hypothetical protein